MATLPKGEYGTVSAATVARDMLHSFPNIRIGLMVGIGGGAPTAEHDVRLGDIVVSGRDGDEGGVFQYDFGKTIQDQTFRHTQHLNQPPQLLLAAVGGLEAQYEADGHQLEAQVKQIFEKKTRLRTKYSRPPVVSDKLYQSDIVHRGPPENCSEACGDGPDYLVQRRERGEEDDNPTIHYGLIASANQLMKDAKIRDRLAADKGVLCFETEAAGLMNHFPCLVIRGICDYADSHKNKEWQGYAAMVAAAYAKELLLQIPANKVEAERRIAETLDVIERKMDGIERIASATQAAIDHFTSGHHTDKIKDWLCPPNHSTNINHARKLRHEGTGDWLLADPFFQSWHSGSRRHLWLYGLAGCGKTILSATVLDHLTKVNNGPFLSFYFEFSDTKKQTLDGMLRSLAFQVFQHRTASRAHLEALYQSHYDGHNKPSTATLSDVVYKMLTEEDKLYIVLDALDESTTRSELLQWIKDTSSRPELHHVQLLCTSRRELEFKRDLPELIGRENCFSLDKQAVNADIRAYVKSQLANRQEFKVKKLSEDLIGLIQRKVGDGADGIWVPNSSPISNNYLTPGIAIKETLERLPKNLPETYKRMLEEIPENLKTGATRLLQFLVHTQWPLTVQEAVEVIATEIGADFQYFDIDRRVFDGTEVLRYCPGLMCIVEARDHLDIIRTELHLAHFSVKEFLETQAHFKQQNASIIITQTCLTYLTDITGSHTEIERDFPMARLAAKIWTSHAGLIKVAEELIARGADVNTQGGEFGNALQAASFTDKSEIMKLLLENGADINAEGGYYGNALQAALLQGHAKIVKLLLENGANANVEGGHFGNALQIASSEGYSEIVKLLLENGANANAEGGYYGSALQAALFQGHTEIAKLLLENGANASAEGGKFGNAQQIASSRGYNEIVKLLLENGANAHAEGGYYGNTL
ncbi:hypothetical protein S7711_09447 [Stachybotrys chartarum IBT 7711]|uniref:NACHT domain-containing protein n=1 Tax=Stachybotrys chartarum (strain CBS 109288 / IBT 7711) TaxID=1280523 RepID=A0A084B8S1_STACB|nr:hypothetical protein S7711_09447 [Stachybotrys chartarum IBT 7711]